VPGLSVDRVRGASYLSTDGVLYPFPAVWGLYETIQSLGVEVVLGIEATGVSTREGRAEALQLGSRHIRTRWIVNAAGGWSGEFNERAGVPVINVATRHEILATEPLKPFLDPMIVRVRDGLYFSQTMRGEIVGGLTLSHAPGTAQGMPSSARFLRAMAQALTELFPPLGSIGVLRSWSGFYDDTPDGLPILGEDPRLRGFVHANGFGGHGFMLAPSATRRVAQILLGQPTDLDPGLFSPGRFQTVKHAAPVERLQLG
jgi:sarcosine oxidase subunit beta